MSSKHLSTQKRHVFFGLSLLLAAGHLFDLLLGLGFGNSDGAFAVLANVWAAWDPMYVAQPFYMEITSLASGLVMIPMTLALAWGFRRGSAYLQWLAPLYLGFILCNNVVWFWNEFYCPEPPTSWLMVILFTSPWWVLPVYFFQQVVTHDVRADDEIRSATPASEQKAIHAT